jgi:hypothetical protein
MLVMSKLVSSTVAFTCFFANASVQLPFFGRSMQERQHAPVKMAPCDRVSAPSFGGREGFERLGNNTVHPEPVDLKFSTNSNILEELEK